MRAQISPPAPMPAPSSAGLHTRVWAHVNCRHVHGHLVDAHVSGDSVTTLNDVCAQQAPTSPRGAYMYGLAWIHAIRRGRSAAAVILMLGYLQIFANLTSPHLSYIRGS